MKDQNEKIVNELLYEATARKVLHKKAKANYGFSNFKRSLAIAASLILLSGIYFLMQPDAITNKQLALNTFDFPNIEKSRSAQISRIDDHLSLLRNEQYAEALEAIKGDNPSNKDLFVKANLFFKLGNIAEAQKIINQQTWDNSAFAEDIYWLEFLISFSNNADSKKLETLINQLNADHKGQAYLLLGNLD